MAAVSVVCELKEVKAIKTSSLDRECRLVFLTPDTSVLELGKDQPDTLYTITIEREQ